MTVCRLNLSGQSFSRSLARFRPERSSIALEQTHVPFEVPLAMRWGLGIFCVIGCLKASPRCSLPQVSVPVLAVKVLSVSRTKGGGYSKESLILKVKI